MIIKNCLICKKEFKIKKYRENNAKFCSRKCCGNFTIGKELSEETKKKISLANMGKIVSLETRKKLSDATKGKNIGRPAWNKGKTKKDDNRIAQPWLNKKRPDISIIKSGKNSNFWKGGISSKNELIRKNSNYKLWRKSCFERDNFTCQKYGIRGGKLRVHHINNFADFPELRTSIENGITLSDKAHKEFHHIYGYKNNTKEQLNEFLMM